MITPRASAAIDWLFEQAIHDTCTPSDGSACVLTRLDAPPANEGKRQLMVLNISSYLFRLVALFDFALDEATAAHLSPDSRAAARLDGQALLDACAERVNMICGAVNRGLSATFWHAGMSTPLALESSCVQHVDILQPEQVSVSRIDIGTSVRFHLTVCVCPARGSTLDFDVDRTVATADAAGELELF
jgi:hypothetical protein